MQGRSAERPAEHVVQDGTRWTAQLTGISAGIALLTVLIYAQVRHFGFVYLDDFVYVVDNARVVRGLSWEGARWALTTQAAGNWHPLTWISHMVDVELYGLNAGGHHVTSVVIHVANSVLLFAAVYRMTHGVWRSAVAAALFAVHPLHVESVAWVSERKDVLSALFWILTVHAYVSYVRKRSVERYLLVLFCFALGLMSKPMVVTLPFALLLLDYWPLKRVTASRGSQFYSWLGLVKEKLPLFILTVSSMIVTVTAQRGYGAVVALERFSLKDRVANSIVGYVGYLRDLLWPSRLAAFYPFQQHSAAYVAICALIMLGLTMFAVLQRRRRPYILFGWAWYVGTLIPVIGLVQVGDQARADRYMYIPAIGLFITAAWIVHELASRWAFHKIVLSTLATIVVGACAMISLRQVSYWKDNVSLFTRATNVTTRNYRAEALLGAAYSASGRDLEAIEHYRTSLAIWNGNAEVHANLGTSLSEIGKSDEALRELKEAVRQKPGNAVYHYNYGVMLNQTGHSSEALAEVRRAAELDPANKLFQGALATLLSRP